MSTFLHAGPYLLSFFLSAAAVADHGVGNEPVDESRQWKVSELLKSTAVSQAGEPLGDVEDIVFGAKGEVYAVLLNRDLASSVAGQSEPVEEGRRRSMYEETLSATFERAAFKPREARLQLSGKAIPVHGHDDREPSPVGRFYASRIIGVPVNLADEDGYGKVVDILILPDSTEASGIVIETGLFNKEVMLPPDFAAFDEDAREMNFAVSKADIESE